MLRRVSATQPSTEDWSMPSPCRNTVDYAIGSESVHCKTRMGQLGFQFQQRNPCICVSPPIPLRMRFLLPLPIASLSLPFHKSPHLLLKPQLCRNFTNPSGSDIVSQLELQKPEERRKPERRANGIFWIILLNLGIYVADHLFQVQSIQKLYLYHKWPVWYQFVTATFCHANWQHLSSNLFFLYIFGKLVEEEEGNFMLWVSYIVTGVGANIVSWLILPRNAVSVGASGAVFGLFAISVLVKMSWDWRKVLEVLILGQFVIDKVMEAAQASTGLSARGLQNVNHIAHLSGALIGVALVWLLSRVPSEPPNIENQSLHRKTNT